MYMNAVLFRKSCARAVAAPQRAHEIGVDSPAIARAAAASRNPRLFVLLPFNAFVDAVFRREGADYGFPLNPKHAAAALRLSQNRPRPAPISILSALP